MKLAQPEILYYFVALATVLAVRHLLMRGSQPLARSKQRSVITLSLRSLTIAALLVALCGPYLELKREHSEISLLLDISDSVDSELGTELIDRVSSYAGEGVKIDVYPFAGQTAPVSVPFSSLSGYRRIKESWSKLNIGETNIEQAMRALPSAGNMLLISDGYENKGDVRTALAQLSSGSAKIYPLLPKNSAGSAAFRISKLYAPLVAPAEKSVDIRVSLLNSSTEVQHGVLSVSHDGKSLSKQKVSVAPGAESLFVIPSDPSKEGIREVTATLQPLENGFGSSSETIYVSGASREKILLLSGDDESASFLSEALASQAYRLKTVTAPSAAAEIPALDSFSTVIVNNIAKKQLPSSFLPNLEKYAKLGGGVALIGGPRSFGLGGYIDTPLETISPVSFVPPQTEKKRLNVAVSLVLDKSHSMREGNKISFVKDAARAVIQNLKDDDFIQVIGFDENPFVAVKMSRLAENRQLALDRIDRLYPAGRTNPLPAMDEARRSMAQVQAGRKHVIIMTDGKIPEAGLYYIGIVNQLRAVGSTVSTVLLGSETDTAQLKAIANAGGGGFYQTTDSGALPKIFVSDVKVATGEKTQKENREYMVRAGTGKVSSTSVGSFPPLLGYVQTKMKENANLELIVYAEDRAEPLLASWTYGKGHVTTFSSDANGRWSQRWVDWPSFRRFWSEIIDTLRSSQGEDEESSRFDLRYYVEKGQLKLDLTLFSEELSGEVLATLQQPDGKLREFSFQNLSRGHFLAALDSVQAGRFELSMKVGPKKLTTVAFQLSGELFGERKGQGFNVAQLAALASASGGKLNPAPDEILNQKFETVEKVDLGYIFILIAAALFLAEILAREVRRFPLRLRLRAVQ